MAQGDLMISVSRPSDKFSADCFRAWCALNQLILAEGLSALMHLAVNEPEAAAILRRIGLKPLTRKHLESIAATFPRPSPVSPETRA